MCVAMSPRREMERESPQMPALQKSEESGQKIEESSAQISDQSIIGLSRSAPPPLFD
jgi:hypothetical protein